MEMKPRLIFDENGDIADVIEESEMTGNIRDIYEDPYWRSKTPIEERKHKKPSKIEWTGGRIAIVAGAIILIIGSLYYIAVQLLNVL